MPPPPPPPTYAVSQSTYTPSDDMVEALIEALYAQKWRMKTSLWPQQVPVCGTLHEDKLCKGVVLNVEQTDGGKSHNVIIVFIRRSYQHHYSPPISLHCFHPN